MEWFKLYTKMPRDAALRRAQRRSDALAGWVLTLAMCYVGEQESDGHIPEDEPEHWGVPNVLTYVEALAGEGILTRVDDGWVITRWLDRQKSKAQMDEQRKATAKRVEQFRKRSNGVGNGVTNGVGNASRLEESRREDSPYPADAGSGCPAHEKPAKNCRGCKTNPRAVRAESRKAKWGPWCGACDERTRMFENVGGEMERCSCRFSIIEGEGA